MKIPAKAMKASYGLFNLHLFVVMVFVLFFTLISDIIYAGTPQNNTLFFTINNPFTSIYLFLAIICLFIFATLPLRIYKQKTKKKLLLLNQSLERNIQLRTQDLEKEISERKKTELDIKKINAEYELLLATATLNQEKYYNLIQYLPAGILYLDTDGKILDMNPAFLNIMGSKSEDLSNTLNLLSLQQTIDAGIADDFKNCLITCKVVTNECLYFSYWGKRLFLHYIFTPIFNKKHEITSILGTFEDITERKNMEVTLKNSEKKLREANDAKDKFLSIIAHDIKTPFNAILGFSDLLREEYDKYSEEERKDFIRNINEAAEVTLKLLDNLLQWSRSQAGKMEVRPQNIDIYIIVKDTLDFLRATAEKKLIQFNTQIFENCKAFADKNTITTVIRNLISNAIKFSYSGGQITIQNRQLEKFIEISVSDNGIGMSNNEVKRLFKLDEKFKKEGTAREQGTGLGLILCKEFVEKNGGWIWAESEPGKGSSFKFTLPKEKS